MTSSSFYLCTIPPRSTRCRYFTHSYPGTKLLERNVPKRFLFRFLASGTLRLSGLQSCDRLMSLIILPWLSLLALPIMDVGVDSKPPACLCRNNPNTLLGSSLRNCVSFPRFYPVAQSRCRCSSWLRTL